MDHNPSNKTFTHLVLEIKTECSLMKQIPSLSPSLRTELQGECMKTMAQLLNNLFIAGLSQREQKKKKKTKHPSRKNKNVFSFRF